MTQPQGHDPKELLGGYATDTLSPAEKARLFQAALRDQELFDALADEEALKELLADPAARVRLLEALGQPKVVPFWRRPAVLGLAAGLMLLVTTTVLLRRQPQMLNPVKSKSLSSEEKVETPPAAAPAPEAKAASKPESEKAKLDAELQEKAKGGGPRSSKGEEGVPLVADLSQAKGALAPKAEALVGAAAPPAPAASAPQAMPSAPLATWEEKSADRASEDASRARSAEFKAARKPSENRAVSKLQAVEFPAPVCRLERQEGGRWLLKVQREARGHLYVLKRQGADVSRLAPARTATDAQGRPQLVFEGQGGGVLDIYLLQDETPHPERLPAEDPANGRRVTLRLEP